MSVQKTCLILLVILAAGALLAGCVSQPSPLPIPRVTITSPANGATVPAGNVTVTVQVRNFTVVDKQGQANVAGEGHIHYYLDVSPIPSTPNQPAIPANADAVWAHVAATSYTFTNVPPGMHTISVQLANNNHTPVIPLATDSVMIIATSPVTTPTPTTSPTTGQVTSVTLVAKNIAFNTSTITVPRGSTVVLTFENEDAGIPHNFALYTDSSATTRLFAGDFVTGPKTVTYTFTAPSQPGTYYFRCDVHPTQMFGSFVVI